MDRSTTEITIGTHLFAVKTYATAREHQTIKQALMKDTKVEISGELPKFNDFSPSVLFDMHEEMVRQMVVLMDGTADTIVDRCLNLPSADYDELVVAIDAIIAKKKLIDAAVSYYSMGRANGDMQMVAIMQEFGWTYTEFMQTPNYVITLIIEKMTRDRKEQELQAKRQNRG